MQPKQGIPALAALLSAKPIEIMQQTKRKSQAQGRIDYIIQGNAPGVRKLVSEYGYQPPKDPVALSKAVKRVIREKGRPAIKRLISQHPDRKIILRLEKEKDDNYCSYCGSSSSEDSFCGSCSHSNYDDAAHENLLDRLLQMRTDELERYYEELLEKANSNPGDTTLAGKLQQAWAEIRQRRLQPPVHVEDNLPSDPVKEEKAPEGFSPEQLILILGLTLTAGVLVGVSIKIGGNG